VFHLPCQHPKPKKAGSSLKPARLP
jgi:hypothetical protein